MIPHPNFASERYQSGHRRTFAKVFYGPHCLNKRHIKHHINHMNPPLYRSKTWLFDPSNSTITQGRKQIKLRNHLAQIMYLLCHNPHQFVSHQQLIAEVWGGNHLVAKKSIRNAIWELRKHVPEIKTIPKQGYQLNAKVTPMVKNQALLKDRYRSISLLIMTLQSMLIIWLLCFK